jgi:hypothetical protein
MVLRARQKLLPRRGRDPAVVLLQVEKEKQQNKEVNIDEQSNKTGSDETDA